MINKTFRFMAIVLIAIYCTALQGCIIAAVVTGVMIHKKNKEHKLAEVTPEQRAAYNKYVLFMQKQNAKKSKAGLKADPIMSIEDYVDAMNKAQAAKTAKTKS